MPDSLKKEFKTKNGRKVYDGGGVDPDIVVPTKNYSQIAQSLMSKLLVFDFATQYRNKNASIAEAKDFKISEADFEDFKKFITDKDYGYTTSTEKSLDEFKKKAEEEKYFDAVKLQYESMKKELQHDKKADIEKNKEEIKLLLEEEIAKRYYFQKAHYEAAFDHDEDILEALKVLADKNKYESILKPVAKK
jgi:carboxyl-terminal processing protease